MLNENICKKYNIKKNNGAIIHFYFKRLEVGRYIAKVKNY